MACSLDSSALRSPLPAGPARPRGPVPGAEAPFGPPGPPQLCGDHGEGLTLFCLDHLEPVCRECGETETHAGHRVYPLTEALSDCKGELQAAVSRLQRKVIKFEKVSQTSQHSSQHNQVQAQWTERRMKEEFEKLHQFLREEEEARLAALREEAEERKRGMKEKGEGVTRALESLEEKIGEIEEEIEEAEGDGVEFLQNYQDTIKRTWQSHEEPEKVSGPLIDVSKHVGNLRYTVWNKMKEIAPYTPVTLDPSTACPSLGLSPGLTVVHWAPRRDQELPANPERFHPYSCILGRERFCSGSHSWEVEVGDSTNWTVGVASASVCRGEFEACPEAGLWTLSLREGEYRAMSTPCQPLALHGAAPRRLRLRLDMDGGWVSFLDADRGSTLFTFTHWFSEEVAPYFETVCERRGLEVLSRRARVGVETEVGGTAGGGAGPEDGEVGEVGEAGCAGDRLSEATCPTGDQIPQVPRPPAEKHQTAKTAGTKNQTPVEESRPSGKAKASGTGSSGENTTPTSKNSKVPLRKPRNQTPGSNTTRYNNTYHVSLNRSLKTSHTRPPTEDQGIQM